MQFHRVPVVQTGMNKLQLKVAAVAPQRLFGVEPNVSIFIV
jgi:hypothetical protein